MRVLLIIVATLAACSSLADLPSNGGFEKTGRAGDAVGWEPLVMGAPAEFSLDPATHKSGARSMKISAAEITRAYAVSDFMPVSAGERFTATAWVLQTNVPSGKGTVIAIAEFCDSEERQTSVSKIGIADSSKQDWQLVSGSASVPDGAAFLRLRLGFSYSQGTCWWDDVRVKFAGELAARFDVPHGRLTPAREGVEVTVLNRAGLTDHVGLQIESSSSGPATVPVKLTGEPLQRVRVPMTFQKPGKLVLKGSIFKTNSAVACRFAAQVAVPPPLGLEPLVPTHWTVEDGAGRIEGRAHLALPAAELTAATLKVRLMNSDGKLCAETVRQGLVDDANDFSIEIPALPVGDYELSAEVGEGTRKIAETRESWAVIHRAQASVSLNGEGYPVYGNEAVFPLGIFNGGARMREMAESGFSVTHSYNSVEAQAFGRLDDSRAKAFLDDTHRAGMKALMLLPRKALFARDWDTVRRRVLMFRNHPGLLAWDEEEGIARGDMKPETLRELAAIVKELDLHHPLMVGDSRDVIGRIAPDRANFFLDDSMDLGMWWWYPFPVSAKANALEGDEAGSPENMPLPAFMVNATTCKPLWIGIQAYKKPGASARYPTREEYRFQAYAALCAGARGLMWYGGSVTGGAYLNPKESEWEYIKSLVSELRSLEPALTGKMVKLRVEPESSAVSAVLRQGEGRTILTAVNRTTHKGEASVSVEGWVSAVRLPQGEVVRIESGVLHERFEPLGVSLYELRR